MTDELDQRLRAADPASRDVDSARSQRATSLKEHIMSLPTEASTTSPTDSVTSLPTTPARSRRWLLPVAAAVVAVAGVAAVLALGGSDDPSTSVALTGTDGASMGMCIALSAEILAPVESAFDGVVASIDGSQATLDVTTWFKGGDAETVTIDNPNVGQPALIEGIEFTVGGRYLVSASAGVVNGCGFSGPYSPELEAVYLDAFGG